MSDELPDHTHRLFAHYDDPGNLPTVSPHMVLTRLLEEGDRSDLLWLTSAHSEPRLAAWLDKHGHRQLSRRSLGFWRTLLDRTDPAEERPGESIWPL